MQPIRSQDLYKIEHEARRLRAQFVRAAARSLHARLSALFHRGASASRA